MRAKVQGSPRLAAHVWQAAREIISGLESCLEGMGSLMGWMDTVTRFVGKVKDDLQDVWHGTEGNKPYLLQLQL